MFVTHHGAGSSGLSFAAFTAEVRKILPAAGVLSLDARGHGGTTVSPSSSGQPLDQNGVHGSSVPDLTLEALASDLVFVVKQTKSEVQWTELPDLLLIGHSLGGAVVTEVAISGELGTKVLGYAVLDVVEGSAMDALQSMETYLSTRPAGFPSLASGIEWQ